MPLGNPISTTDPAIRQEASQEPLSPRRRALLIGVRTYPQIPRDWGGSLAGCHNDVAAMRSVLLERGFVAGDVAVLVDPVDDCCCIFCTGEVSSGPELPTRQGILEAIRSLVQTCDRDDIVVVYFSGHGSELSGRRLQAGRRTQTLVPHDSGRQKAPNRDIGDHEVAAMQRAFQHRTRYLTLIFDCCHSGGLSDVRGNTPRDESRGRSVRADDRSDDEAFDPGLLASLQSPPPSTDSDSDSHSGTGPGSGPGAETGLRGKTPSEESTAVVLSASAAHELSSETVQDGTKYGLFTLRLTQALAEKRADEQRWSDLFPRLAERVSGENLAQHPRRRGDGPIFALGHLDPHDIDPPDSLDLHKLAVVIGLDYDPTDVAAEDRPRHGFSRLETPARDAEEVARVLKDVQGYEIVGLSRRRPGPLLNAKATRRRIHKLIHRLIDVRSRTRRECAVLIYFAGHGVTRTLDDGTQAGYLIPWDGEADDPSTWLPMKDLRDQLVNGIRDAERLATIGLDKPLTRLTSRHLLLVMDCCFGGAMSYDFFRGEDAPRRPIYYSEYRRFVEGRAWQLLTSASYNQQAMDRDPKDPSQLYSPFAQAFIEGLASDAADRPAAGASDNIITAGELHQFIDGQLRRRGVDIQTPGLIALRPTEGQYIFHVPGTEPTPLPDPPLDPSHAPWPGAAAYDDAGLFCGRLHAGLDLLACFLGRAQRPLAVVGPSGSGKTSLVQAALLPWLTDPVAMRQRWQSGLQSSGLGHSGHPLLVSREDLEGLRAWCSRIELDLTASAADLVHQVRHEADARGWIDSPSSASKTQTALDVERQSLGIPSFVDSGAVAAQALPNWWRRLGLRGLLASAESAPDAFAQRLQLWCEEGGLADAFSLDDAELKQLVGKWQVVTSWDDATAWLASDDAEVSKSRKASHNKVLLWIDALDDIHPLSQRITQETWRTFNLDPRTAVIATCQPSAPEARPTEARPAGAWHLFRVPKPNRQELLDVVRQPAAARVLFFEPEDLPRRLVEQVLPMPSPLAELSTWLRCAVEKAWQRRRDGDRLLTSADFERLDAPSRVRRRAEASFRQLSASDPVLRRSLRALLRRFLTIEGSFLQTRPVAWRELHMADDAEQRRLHHDILPTLIAERVLVADPQHLQLAHPDLVTAWPRLRRWQSPRGRKILQRTDLWQRAIAWQSAGYDHDKLLHRDLGVPRLFRLSTLNRLERALVVHSEMLRRTSTVQALVHEAQQGLEHNWPRSAALAAEAMQLARDTVAKGRDLGAEMLRQAQEAGQSDVSETVQREVQESFRLAYQTLHDVLATTPLGVPLTLPEASTESATPGTTTPARLRGIAFDGDATLRARFKTAEGSVVAVTWDLTHLDRPGEQLNPAEGLHDGQGEVRPTRILIGPVIEFPMVPKGPTLGPKVQSGHDHGIRLFPPGRLALPAELHQFVAPPLTLLGHTRVPTFLAFSPDRQWLVSAADSDGADSEGGDPEVRLWPLGGRSDLRSQPATLPRTSLAEVLDDSGLSEAEASSNASTSDLAPPSRISSRALRPDGHEVAEGSLDGTVRLSPSTEFKKDSAAAAVLLRSPRDRGFAVRALAYSPTGDRLWVERRAVYAPHSQRVDVYRLDLDTLICLARGHAGHPLRESDLPSDLWQHLQDSKPQSPPTTSTDAQEASRRHLQRYLSALGLSHCMTSHKETP